MNDRLQTTNPKIFAAGDICSQYKFTHAVEAMAQLVIPNALFPHPLGLGYGSTNSLIIPWCDEVDWPSWVSKKTGVAGPRGVGVSEKHDDSDKENPAPGPGLKLRRSSSAR